MDDQGSAKASALRAVQVPCSGTQGMEKRIPPEGFREEVALELGLEARVGF